MTDAAVLDVVQRGLVVAATICAPVLGFGLVVGLVISVFQAATQIHEMSLTFIPKIIAVAAAIAIFGPWMLSQVVNFTGSLLESIPTLVR
ncbi:MAG TPA: flagellar biosynthesis protein FliQ [Armatimonadota bacterium]|nr:flagellar biosynthesis protein FliQ [Armatimonadota bacterium]HPP75168.1 flagellar biosynthesis protein FliQ [Armatimonadota bacterium]